MPSRSVPLATLPHIFKVAGDPSGRIYVVRAPFVFHVSGQVGAILEQLCPGWARGAQQVALAADVEAWLQSLP